MMTMAARIAMCPIEGHQGAWIQKLETKMAVDLTEFLVCAIPLFFDAKDLAQ